MKKLLFLCFAVLVFYGCKTVQDTSSDLMFGKSMKTIYEREFSQVQLDSICQADNLPKDLTKWKQSVFTDWETGKPINEYLYMRFSGQKESVYRVEKMDDKYKVSKRIAE